MAGQVLRVGADWGKLENLAGTYFHCFAASDGFERAYRARALPALPGRQAEPGADLRDRRVLHVLLVNLGTPDAPEWTEAAPAPDALRKFYADRGRRAPPQCAQAVATIP